jgi:hypothetical protein
MLTLVSPSFRPAHVSPHTLSLSHAHVGCLISPTRSRALQGRDQFTRARSLARSHTRTHTHARTHACTHTHAHTPPTGRVLLGLVRPSFCPEVFYPVQSRPHNVHITSISRPRHAPVTPPSRHVPSRPYHVPIPSSSRPHHVPVTSNSLPRDVPIAPPVSSPQLSPVGPLSFGVHKEPSQPRHASPPMSVPRPLPRPFHAPPSSCSPVTALHRTRWP